MREIVLDTETTGLNPQEGHRLVEIGCVELINHIPTGKTFQTYVNPERDIPSGAFEVHGLSADFLSNHPLFSEIVEDFLHFIQNDPLVIHNASFDLKFLNHELRLLNKPNMPVNRAIDTLQIARTKFPGSPASLDALCKRFKIDNSRRTKHGALLDSELLAEVYIELKGGRQPTLSLVTETPKQINATKSNTKRAPLQPRPHTPTAEELSQHKQLLKKLTNSVWPT